MNVFRKHEEINSWLPDTDYIYKKLTELKDRSKRNNLRSELWDQCIEGRTSYLKKKIGLWNITIECIHRISNIQIKIKFTQELLYASY